MKITFLLHGTHDQRFASVTLFAEVYLLFCTMYGNHYFNKLKTKAHLFIDKMILKLQKRKVI